ncbi:MAG TPA: hypothetical protein VJU18_06390 [Vicinamibacteria bacterium]|nr:hypothetical protein [Vicinamibacteria bacterium]
MTRRSALAALTVVMLAAAVRSEAIPAFARRYDLECHFCHQGYPKLNNIGQRFKERGFRLEHEDAFDRQAWSRSVPASMRARARLDFSDQGDPASSMFLKPISAGNLGERFAYWADTGFLIEQDDFSHQKPDNAWLRFEIVKGGKLYARAGRFELDLPFTQARTSHLFPYDIYAANTGFETDNIGGYQDGLEIGGGFGNDLRWSAAVVRGRNPEGAADISDRAGKFDANVFLRASRRKERNRVGLFAYIGRNTIALGPTNAWDDNLLRLGADASLWVQKMNLYGVAMYGRNDNSIATIDRPDGTGQALSFGGGFLQADYHARGNLALCLRFNLVNGPGEAAATDKETLTGIFPGVQLWLFERAKLSFEYGLLNNQRPSYGALQLEVAF